MSAPFDRQRPFPARASSTSVRGQHGPAYLAQLKESKRYRRDVY